MGKYDNYGKTLFYDILGPEHCTPPERKFFPSNIQPAMSIQGDVLIKANELRCIVQIQAVDVENYNPKNPKRLRGALLDLMLDDAQKKLLVLILKQRMDKNKLINHFHDIWEKIAGDKHGEFEVVSLIWNENSTKVKDEEIIKNVLKKLHVYEPHH